MQYDLSVILPSRNEMFLKQTIEDILKNKRAKTEIIATLDGKWADPPIDQHPDVNLIYVPEAIGQRAATNIGVRLSKAKYVMKLDAHCGWDEGYDAKMLEGFKQVGDDVTMVGIMRNLWAFDWVCTKPGCGWKQYQGPTPTQCPKCGRPHRIRRKMMWVCKHNPQSWSYCFDSEPHFQYFEAYKHRPGVKDAAKATGFSETMSLQGSCFMCTREKYWEWNLCDETLGSWGNQGIEVAAKTWLSGGRVLVNHSTYYAHMFRTQGGDFGFPYEQRGRAVAKTKQMTWQQILNGGWGKKMRNVSWLVEKFWPIPGWTDETLAKLKELENG